MAAASTPAEVLLHIISYLPGPQPPQYRPHAELLQLFTVCKSWYGIAEGAFYSRIMLGAVRRPPETAPCPSATAFRDALRKTPRFALLVKELRLGAARGHTKAWADIINACRNLRRIHLSDWTPGVLTDVRNALKTRTGLIEVNLWFRGLLDTPSCAFASEKQMLPLMRAWPDLRVFVVQARAISSIENVHERIVMLPTYHWQPRPAADEPAPADVWNTPGFVVPHDLFTNRGAHTALKMWGPETWAPSIEPGDVWPHLRTISAGFLTIPWLVALPTIAPNVQEFSPGYLLVPGKLLNAVLCAWSSTLRYLHLTVVDYFGMQPPNADALRNGNMSIAITGVTLSGLKCLETMAVDSILVPPATLRFTPPSLRELTYDFKLKLKDDVDDVGILDRTLADTRTAPGLERIVVLLSTSLSEEEMSALARTCFAERKLQGALQSFSKPHAPCVGAESAGTLLNEFDWTKWRQDYVQRK
ncbi:hypothetical protein EXIGLDRAFT_367062 [Exidia glandulosa HHB12029]|uniref:F-box domain-containing protein n=1 Tax=Exidia glandulosa HHB12029 TaxID=1314781 RepID=A0A165L789_EXIGL|nr:hypothetical protein EXIGLDRAFT_367062 [Exidia glandulosa HHB12029]